MRYFIEVSYKGTTFHGWQRQPNAVSVEETLEKGLQTILRTPVRLTGSSRTDTGVHAEQQFAHFDIEQPIGQPDRIVHALNSILPYELAVKALHLVKEEAHSRFDATHRCYEYRLFRHKNPFLTGLGCLYRRPLDIALMNEAAALLPQHEDFECFSKTHTDVKTFLCKIEYAFWHEQNDTLVFHIKANRFLRGMVRAVVGTLLEVGQGKLTVGQFEQIIVSKNRQNAAAQAPAEGLFLTEVGYDWTQIVGDLQ
jgi:tRNA pseudouridine38-40 synthase